jgi:hypothetical protein
MNKKVFESMEDNPLLEFVSYHLKNSFEGYGKHFRFNKYMYLLNKELKKENIDIKLPYYWYNYGVVIHNESYYSYLTEFSINTEKISSNLKLKVMRILDKFMEVYRYKETAEVNKKIYKEAPFLFQDYFRELLKLKDSWNGNKENSYSKEEVSKFSNLIEQLLLNFPETEFKELYPLFLEWENHVSQLILVNYPKKDMASFIEKFWFVFTKKLRTIANENINSQTINYWKDEYGGELLRLEDDLFDFAFIFYNDYYKKNEEIKSTKQAHELASNIIWE